MTRVGAMIETSSATITLVGERSIEQCFRVDARFDPDPMEANRNAREQLSEGKPYGLLIILPDGAEVQPNSTNTDHFRLESVDRRILALAVVANGEAMSMVCKFYFRYYPQSFPVEVFDDEDDARTWLNDRMGMSAA